MAFHRSFPPFYLLAASTIAAKSGAFSEAPPMSPPSISGCARRPAAFLAFMLPPYWIVVASAASSPYKLTQQRADHMVDLIGLLVGRRLAGADGPSARTQ